MRISDWSSDVCSSDLGGIEPDSFELVDHPVFDFVREFVQIHVFVVSFRFTVNIDLITGQLSGQPNIMYTPANRQRNLVWLQIYRSVTGFIVYLVQINFRGRSEENTSELQSLMRNSYT